MVYTLDDLRILAQAYMDATGKSATGLSIEITGIYADKLVFQLLRGKQIFAGNAELASAWFAERADPSWWPEGVAMPSKELSVE